MPYATTAALTGLTGEDVLSRLADRDGDLEADLPALQTALDRADAEIDAYLAVRYPLPLAEVPPILTQIACDIAIYRLGVDGGRIMDEHRTRYEDAIAFLRRLASGGAALAFTPDPDAEEAPAGPRPVVTGGPGRLFSREKTRGL